MTPKDYHTFADSPFFYDRRSTHVPQQEDAVVQVGLNTVLYRLIHPHHCIMADCAVGTLTQ